MLFFLGVLLLLAVLFLALLFEGELALRVALLELGFGALGLVGGSGLVGNAGASAGPLAFVRAGWLLELLGVGRGVVLCALPGFLGSGLVVVAIVINLKVL